MFNRMTDVWLSENWHRYATHCNIVWRWTLLIIHYSQLFRSVSHGTLSSDLSYFVNTGHLSQDTKHHSSAAIYMAQKWCTHTHTVQLFIWHILSGIAGPMSDNLQGTDGESRQISLMPCLILNYQDMTKSKLLHDKHIVFNKTKAQYY